MDHLSKQQVILLALLISFVTSLSTGIVTVSLMDQAPEGVVQTINQVVEKTIEKAVSNEAAVGNVDAESGDRIVQATRSVMPSIVKIRRQSAPAASGLGLIVNENGVILADKSIASTSAVYEAILADGSVIPTKVVQAQLEGDIVFLAPTIQIESIKPKLLPIKMASGAALGQEVFTIAGVSDTVLGHGILTSIESDDSVLTSIPVSKTSAGSPLFNSRGEVLGFRMKSLPADSDTAFYRIDVLVDVIPKN